MSNIIFTPEILFANEILWESDKSYKDNFIKKLFDILEYINSNNDYSILWSDTCENILWNFPNQVPWRIDKDFKNQSIVAINNFLHNSQLLVCSNLDICNISPTISSDDHIDFITEVLKIMHLCLHKNIVYDLCVQNNEDYDITCSCNSNVFKPRVITCKDDFVTYGDVLKNCWNKDKIENSLYFLISYYCKNHLNKKILYNYAFTKSFLKDVLNCDNIRRNTIIKQMSLKLTLTINESRNNGSLQEEFVNNQNRIRITEASRISYAYDSHNIIFTNYYSESEHDIGISNTRR